MVKKPMMLPNLHSYVYELRYNYGYTYLDRCGATINEILRNKPGWVQNDINPQSGNRRCPIHS